MKKGLTVTIVLLIVAAVLAIVGFVGKGDVQKKLDEANKNLEVEKTGFQSKLDDLTGQVGTLTGDLEAAKASLSGAETARTELQTKADELTAQIGTLTTDLETAKAAQSGAEAAGTELQAKVDELTAQIGTLTADLETAKAAQSAAEAAKAELQTKVDELTAQVGTLTADLEAAKGQALLVTPPAIKHGLGMVTSVGSLADATAEKAGAAQVNTTVCSLVLDAEGKIQSVTWDVQQTKIQFSLEGKPVEVPEGLKTKLEKGPEYGMAKTSPIGKEWNEQIEAFGAWVIGKTVDEVLGMPVYERDASHPAVPDVEDLKASVTINVGDYLAALQKAAANAK